MRCCPPGASAAGVMVWMTEQRVPSRRQRQVQSRRWGQFRSLLLGQVPFRPRDYWEESVPTTGRWGRDPSRRRDDGYWFRLNHGTSRSGQVPTTGRPERRGEGDRFHYEDETTGIIPVPTIPDPMSAESLQQTERRPWPEPTTCASVQPTTAPSPEPATGSSTDPRTEVQSAEDVVSESGMHSLPNTLHLVWLLLTGVPQQSALESSRRLSAFESGFRDKMILA
ncbi:uncharacterized protein LOC121432901 isoform X2 [Microtus oregoni]|uniref:uncharacterized protein LOC121432901 isoform X1 n=1 Tax=Microtus oregoni TaxID=111838 RepID=UPI001BB18854|nr:uncharacterized protein LOC121432901 isoform X1 [Microtus oregoni]XP_041487013.1 uncharacterized protein LOC121432901 isoform X2 [Microtus oregoni]